MRAYKKWKTLGTRIISLLLVAALMLATLAGCNKPATPDVNRDIDKKEIEDTEKGTENDDI